MASSSTVGLSGALLVLALLVVSPAAAEISDLGAFPNPFSPNGDGTYDAVEISYYLSEADSVEVDIADSLGAVVRNLNAGDWAQEPGTHSYTWYGLSDASQQQPDGRYTLIVETAGGDRLELTIILDTSAPVVRDLLVSPSRFSPDGDGVADSTRVEFTLDVGSSTDRFWVEVLDAEGESVLELVTGTDVESVSVFWGGRDAEGVAAPDTVYGVRARAVDAAGNEDAVETVVDLDLDPPALFATFAPDPDTAEVRVSASTETTVVGGAYDRAGVDYVLISMDGGDTWSSPEVSRSRRADTYVTWSNAFACEACTLGVRDDTTAVLVRAHDAVLTNDGLGHYNTGETTNPILSFNVVFDVAAPVHVSSTTVDQDAVYDTGQVIKIDSYWDDAGYDVEADFSLVDSAVDSMFDMTDVDVEDGGEGKYRIEYTPSSGNSLVPVYDVPVRVRATDRYGRAVTDTTVTVSVLEASGDVVGLSVDANSFDPTASGTVTITLGEGSGATVDIYNMAGTLVRTLEPGRQDHVSWDGRNDAGDVVASGVYFLHIQTSAGDATRAVAVVK